MLEGTYCPFSDCGVAVQAGDDSIRVSVSLTGPLSFAARIRIEQSALFCISFVVSVDNDTKERKERRGRRGGGVKHHDL